MGREALCTMRIGRRTLHGKALLERHELIFRGDGRIVIPIKDVKSAKADAGAAARQPVDLFFYGAESRDAVPRMVDLRHKLKPAGALWVIRPKGSTALTEAAVMAAGKRAGLVDVKVAGFSETHTAEKSVIPRAAR